MRFVMATALSAALLSVATLPAGEPSAKKPLGSWTRTKDDTTITFRFTDDTLHYTSEGGLGKLVAEADYALSKDGKVLFGRVRTIKEGTGPDKGDLFSFGCTVKGDTLTITDWKGTGATALAGSFIQGDYKKEKGKKE
jgi:hypothetical protein